jgi:hypothetical protein
MAHRFGGRRLKASMVVAAMVVIAGAAAILAGLGGTAAATEPDTTPPAFVLSGTAIKAVEEEAPTGSYELHIAATDGSESEPQSGIAKIEVSVDGSGQQSWEKYCPEGSCSLEESWTWLPANFSGAYHVLSVKVTDHAGNTTEEEITPQGIEEVPRELEHGTDTTPPKISFSGTAVEAAETGATTGEYELRMLAKDGSSAEPQSGVSRIEVAVDGTTLQSFEKYCPVGNCRLRVNWPYAPGNFAGSEHVITVTVRDHAGNVTTRTLELDTTPPEIELSGALTEGLKEGTTEYPLHVHATDGEPEFPQSGVKEIQISVDGEVVETVEQSCKFGSCPMDAEWTLDTATYGFEPHEVSVLATDQAGNESSQLLPVPAPNGSIPACNSAEPEASGTPDEVHSLKGGGTESIYFGGEGTKMRFIAPPEGFRPIAAADEELELYGYPPRPPATEAEAREEWEETWGQATSTSSAGGCMMANAPGFEPGSGVGTATSPRWSGYYAFDPEGPENHWRAARTQFVQPELQNTCPAPADVSSWLGIGGTQGKGFFQAGTTAPFGYPHINPVYEVGAFTEYFRAGEEGKHQKTEKAFHYNLKIEPGDEIFIVVEWKPSLKEIYMRVLDLNTHKSTPGTYIDPHFGRVFDGQSVEYIPAEVPLGTNLQNFEQIVFSRNETLVSGEGWQRLGEQSPLYKLSLQRQNKKEEPVGQILAHPGELLKPGSGFIEHWDHCHQ